MKNKLLSILFTLISIIAIGQNYKISPSKTVNVFAPYNEVNRFEIYFENISNTTITLHWALVSNNLIMGWDCFLCDDGSCCQGVPQKGTLYYIDPGIQAYIALNVDPKTIPGEGVLKLFVYEDGDSIYGDTLTWIVNSSSTGIDDYSSSGGIKVFPNPVLDYANIDLSTHQSGKVNTLCIYNLNGEKLIEKNVNNITQIERLAMTSLTKGLYILEIKDANGKKFTKRILKE